MSTLKSPKVWVGILISVICLAAIALYVDEKAVIEAARTADYRWLALAWVAQLVYLLLRAVRWHYMLDNRNAISITQTFHLQNIGYMLTSLLPLRAGEFARVVMLKNYPPLTIAQGLSTIIVERILDLLFVIALLPITLFSLSTLPDWVRGTIGITAIVAVVAILIVIVAANNRPLVIRLTTAICQRFSFLDTAIWVKQIDGLLAGLVTLTTFRTAATLLFLTLITWLTVIFSYQWGMFTFGLRPTYLQAGFVMCAAALSIAAPSSPGGLGVFHAAIVGSILLLGWNETTGTSFAFLYHALIFSFNVLLGIIGLMITKTSWAMIRKR